MGLFQINEHFSKLNHGKGIIFSSYIPLHILFEILILIGKNIVRKYYAEDQDFIPNPM